MPHNGWVFVSGFTLHNAQFKAQMLMAKIAQIPCYDQYGLFTTKLYLEPPNKTF